MLDEIEKLDARLEDDDPRCGGPNALQREIEEEHVRDRDSEMDQRLSARTEIRMSSLNGKLVMQTYALRLVLIAEANISTKHGAEDTSSGG